MRYNNGTERRTRRICRFCRRWFPIGYRQSGCRFLKEEEANCDAGFTLPFREEALKQGNDMQCLAWLMSDEVQSFLEDLVINLFMHSLCGAQAQPREAVVGAEVEPSIVGELQPYLWGVPQVALGAVSSFRRGVARVKACATGEF